MVASGVGQFSINVKSNIKDFYGDLLKTQKTIKELESKKITLQADSKQLDNLRDKAQRLGLEIRELNLKKKDIKLGIPAGGMNGLQKEMADVTGQIDKLNQKKIAIQTEKTNTDNSIAELGQEIDKLNQKKIAIQSSNLSTEQIASQVASIDQQINTINQKRISIQASAMSTEQIASEMASISSQIDVLNQKKIAIQASMGNTQEALNSIQEIDQKISSLSHQKLQFETEIQPIRTANVELMKVQNEIDKINSKKIDIKFSESMNNMGNKMQSIGNKLMHPFGGGKGSAFGFGVANNLIDRGMSAVTGQLGGATERYDTLNNYTKVMSNMNISQKEAEASQKVLVAGIKGMPTSLDKSVQSVQRFTSANQDVGKSTDIFLALNDAILAGGASSEVQASAMEQISQAYAKGKPDMVEWRSLQLAMPAQIMQIAKAFNMTESELGEAVRGGSISMDEFMAKIVELDKNGGAGFQSFSQQAKNAVGGVNTGMANLKNAMQRGIAESIGSVDKMLKNQGFGGIAGALEKVGEGFENAFKAIGKAISDNEKEIGDFFKQLGEILSSIDYQSFFDGFISGLQSLMSMISGFMKLVSPIFKLLGNGNVANGLGRVIPLMFQLGLAMRAIGTAMKIIGGAGAVFGFFNKLSGLKLGGLFGGKGGGGGGISAISNAVGKQDFAKLGLQMAKLAGLSANVYIAAKAMQQINEIGDLDGVTKKLASMAVAITGMGALAFAVDKVTDSMKGSFLSSLLSLAGIIGAIYIGAVALEKLNEIDSNFKDVASKIGHIAVAVTAIGALAVVVGVVVSSGIGGGVLLAGLISLIGILGTLVILGWELKKFEDFELNSEKIDENIKTVSDALSSVATMAFDIDVLGSIASLLTNIINMGLLAEMLVMAHELKALQEIELDPEMIKTNVNAIKDVLNSLGTMGADMTLEESFNNLTQLLDNKIMGGLLGQLVTMANKLSELQEIELEPEIINTNVATIRDVLNNLGTLGADMTLEESFNNLSQLLDNVIMGGLLNQIVTMGNKLAELQEIELEPEIINTNISTIRDSLKKIASLAEDESIGESLSLLGELLNTLISNGIISQYLQIGNQLIKLQELELDENKINKVINVINGSIKKIGSKSILDSFGTILEGGFSVDSLKTTKAIIREYYNIGKELIKIQGLELNGDKVNTQLNIIDKALHSISGFATNNIVNNLNGISQALSRLVDQLTKTYPPKFLDLGKVLAQKMNDGFKSKLNFKDAVNAKMRSISTDSARGTGSRLASAMNSSFKNNLQLGDAVSKSIRQAMAQDYSTTIKINTVTSKGGSGSASTVLAGGGLVTGGVGGAGVMLKDSSEHPLLNNGEFVVPKRVVRKLGVPFLRSMQENHVSKTFQGLSQGISNTTSSVVNNVFNNDNSTSQAYNIFTGTEPQAVAIANRRVR